MGILVKHSDNVIDKFGKYITDRFPMVEAPLKHTLTETQYIREILMYAGSIVISEIHKTEHPYFVLQGVVSIFSENDGEQLLQAGDSGITKPNTRRVLYIHEDCKFVTVHSRLPNETIDEIGERILEKHDNPLLSEEIKNKFLSLKRYGLNDTKTILQCE